MKGVEAYDGKDFHPTCKGVQIISNGGFLYLWCPECRVLARLESVSPKFENFKLARTKKEAIA